MNYSTNNNGIIMRILLYFINQETLKYLKYDKVPIRKKYKLHFLLYLLFYSINESHRIKFILNYAYYKNILTPEENAVQFIGHKKQS